MITLIFSWIDGKYLLCSNGGRYILSFILDIVLIINLASMLTSGC